MLQAVGFVGLGAMGAPMAHNIANSSNARVHVYDVDRTALDSARSWAEVHASPAEMAANCQLVISMLPADRHVRDVVLGKNGVAEGAERGTIFADFSTISPNTIVDVARVLAEKGIDTVGGAATLGVPAAKAGTLTVYVDGDAPTIDRCRPIFSCFAKTILYVGACGSAKLVKLMNNYLVGVNVAFTAEALALGVKAGLQLPMLIETLSKGSADSYALRHHFGKAVIDDDLGKGKFSTDYMIKDLSILLEYCRTAPAPAMFAALALSLYRGASAAGYGEHYYPIVMRWLGESLEAPA
jgi:3-hydroxyisobutyrate dehydrogenase-like beta-hydroxyacid dehydrogenase